MTAFMKGATEMKYVISEFKPMGGKHCITNALKQVFEYYQKPMTEAMLLEWGRLWLLLMLIWRILRWFLVDQSQASLREN